MGRIPIISGDEAIRRFAVLGYRVVRQRGSHVRMRHVSDSNRKPLTIPTHTGTVLKPGLLRALIRQAGITVEQFSTIQ